MQAPLPELTERTRDIFARVVEAYLERGEPVGSRTLAQAGINLSPASIRSVLSQLEDQGLLAAPHTSAGRMPTEQGLRLFVDGMMRAAEPTAEERRAIESRLGADGPVEEALAAATQALAGLSACAGLVLAQKGEPAIRQLNFVRLDQRRGIAVLVGQDGSIENRIVELPPQADESLLVAASNYAAGALGGLTLAQALVRLEEERARGMRDLDSAAAELIARGLADWSHDAADRRVLIVRGQAHLLDDASEDLDRVRQLMDELERKEAIAAVIARAREGQATRIFIGSENQLFALSGSAVIAAPYRDRGGRVVGVVGIIGPTRLNYARIVPMVDFTAQALSRFLG